MADIDPGASLQAHAQSKSDFPPVLLEQAAKLVALGRSDALGSLIKRCLKFHSVTTNAAGQLVVPYEIVLPEGGFADLTD